MRKIIFKNEIEHVFQQYKIEKIEQDRIKSELFINQIRNNKRLDLNSKISFFSDFDKVLNEGKNGQGFSVAFKSLFEVDEDLKIPVDLKRLLIGNSPVAIFIGAGVSKLLGYPLWGELANQALDFLLDKGQINHSELNKLRNEISDPKQILSIFERFCKRKSEMGKEFYQKALKKGSIKPSQNPYIPIVSPSLSWIKITSNVDYELLDALYERESNEFNKNKKSDVDENARYDFMVRKDFIGKRIVSDNFLNNGIRNEKLYYIHGQYDALDKTIFTTENYIKNYYNSDSLLQEFLRKIFKSHTVIFVGYGLAEFPILESVMNQGEKEHYALMPSYYNESNIFRIKERFYSHLNITPIPYYIDFKGYKRLYDVLVSWEREIRTEKNRISNDSYYENLDLIDEVL